LLAAAASDLYPPFFFERILSGNILDLYTGEHTPHQTFHLSRLSSRFSRRAAIRWRIDTADGAPVRAVLAGAPDPATRGEHVQATRRATKQGFLGLYCGSDLDSRAKKGPTETKIHRALEPSRDRKFVRLYSPRHACFVPPLDRRLSYL
jgi:hypothetical protein